MATFAAYQKSMKILLLIRYFDFGGAENHVCELANALHEAGHTVIIVSRKGRQLQRLHPEIIHYAMDISSKKVLFHFFRLIQITRRHRIELIHAHQRLPLTIASALGRVTRIPAIGTVHSRLKQDMRKKWVRKGLKRIIVVCKNSYKGTQEDPTIKDITRCIPNGIKLPKESIVKIPEKLQFFYVSRLDAPHTKIVKFLIHEAWPLVIQSYPEACLKIVGDGIGMPVISQMIGQIEDPKIAQSVSIAGYAANISSEIKDASLIMGVGRVAMESLALGIPVLSMKNNRMGPLITCENFDRLQYGNFVDVEAGTPTTVQFMGTINEFVSNHEFYKNETLKLSKKMFETANIQETSEAIIQVYNEVLQP